MRIGVAVADITPPPGLAMAGFAARTEPALGAHDGLTVRAIAVDDTALLVADVIGLDGAMSARIRARAGLAAERIVVAALHNHGGPLVRAGGMAGRPDAAYLDRLEAACVAALDQAVAAQRQGRWRFGLGVDPDIARNRRHAGGPVDRMLPVLVAEDMQGRPIVHLLSYACHPVVLGADNRLWTADYPHFVRAAIEAALPGTVAVFLTGCAGEANTGHSAHASISTAARPERSFAEAERIGRHIAACALRAELSPCGEGARAGDAWVELDFARRETQSNAALAAAWREEAAQAEPARRALLEAWVGWAEGPGQAALAAERARVALLDWGGVRIAALPGEIFAATAAEVRAGLGGPCLVGAYAEACGGYVPPRGEYAHGGYEVEEAHRYYGAPATYAPGCAERLAAAVVSLGLA